MANRRIRTAPLFLLSCISMFASLSASAGGFPSAWTGTSLSASTDASLPASTAATSSVAVVPRLDEPLNRFVYRQVHMGMQVRLVLYASEDEAAAGAASAAFAEIARLDAIFSDYRHDSEVRLLSDPGGRRRVSDELFFVLERATALARQTGGGFDPAAGALTALWRRAIELRRLPRPAEIVRASERSGYDKLELDAAAHTVEITASGVRLDLGGVAKGYILDRALAVLRQAGAERALVEAGGDIVAGASPPGNRGWMVAVPHLGPGVEGRGRTTSGRQGPGGKAAGSEGPGCKLRLANAAVSTSGDQAQFVEVEGRRYSHAVDPRTGLGLTHGRTATVIARDGITADGLATALTIVEEERMDELLELYPSARVILSAADCEW